MARTCEPCAAFPRPTLQGRRFSHAGYGLVGVAGFVLFFAALLAGSRGNPCRCAEAHRRERCLGGRSSGRVSHLPNLPKNLVRAVDAGRVAAQLGGADRLRLRLRAGLRMQFGVDAPRLARDPLGGREGADSTNHPRAQQAAWRPRLRAEARGMARLKRRATECARFAQCTTRGLFGDSRGAARRALPHVGRRPAPMPPRPADAGPSRLRAARSAASRPCRRSARAGCRAMSPSGRRGRAPSARAAGPVFAGEQVVLGARRAWRRAASFTSAMKLSWISSLERLEARARRPASRAGTGRASPCSRRTCRAGARRRSCPAGCGTPNEPPTTPIEPTIETWVGDDLVGRAGDHVAAGGRDILDEGDDRHVLLLGEPRMRLKIRCDCTAEPPGELISSATAAGLRMAKARSSARRHDGERQARAQRRREADGAGEADDRHARHVAAQAARQHAADRGQGLVGEGGIVSAHARPT